jgi:DNA-binding transcriptional MerR regulator
MGVYSIKDLEQLSGIKAHTIRIWEQRYGLIDPKRTDTNIRYYDDEQLKFLLNVALLIRHGQKISRIAEYSSDRFGSEVERIYEQSLIHDTEVVLELDANDLMVAMIDMDAEKFHRIYENSVKLNGFERTITHLIYPFLEKVGMLWSIGQINPAHEHFMSCLIRQKVLAATDRLSNPTGGKRFLLFLPAGEHHEIGLMMANYLLKKRGCQTYYLGQNLPDSDLQVAAQTVKPDAFLTFMADPTLVNNAQSTLKRLSALIQDQTLLVATRPLPSFQAASLPNVHLLHSIGELDAHMV